MEQENGCTVQKSITNVRMNDNVDLYHKTNNVTRNDGVKLLDEYVHKFVWKNEAQIMDVGSADGSVTDILCSYLPINYKLVMGCDINEKSVEFANKNYGDERRAFIVLDIEKELPDDLKEKFDYVFSFYCLHWLLDPEKGMQNIYKLLYKGGECLMTISGLTPFYSIFYVLSNKKKWKHWLKGYDTMVSPYHECEDPDEKISKTLSEIGFQYVDVRCKQKMHVYENIDVFRSTIKSVNPFSIPRELSEEFMDDYVDTARAMGFINKANNKVTFVYNLIVVHCMK